MHYWLTCKLLVLYRNCVQQARSPEGVVFMTSCLYIGQVVNVAMSYNARFVTLYFCFLSLYITLCCFFSHKIYVQLLKMILAKFCVYLYYYIIYSFHTSRSIAFYVIFSFCNILGHPVHWFVYQCRCYGYCC